MAARVCSPLPPDAPVFTALDVLALLTAGLLTLLAAGLLARRPRQTGMSLLAALLLVNAAAVARGLLARQDLLGVAEAGTLVVVLALFLAIPPLLFGFIVYTLDAERAWTRRDLVHLGPALGALVALSISAALLPDGVVLDRAVELVDRPRHAGDAHERHRELDRRVARVDEVTDRLAGARSAPC